MATDPEPVRGNMQGDTREAPRDPPEAPMETYLGPTHVGPQEDTRDALNLPGGASHRVSPGAPSPVAALAATARWGGGGERGRSNGAEWAAGGDEAGRGVWGLVPLYRLFRLRQMRFVLQKIMGNPAGSYGRGRKCNC